MIMFYWTAVYSDVFLIFCMNMHEYENDVNHMLWASRSPDLNTIEYL